MESTSLFDIPHELLSIIIDGMCSALTRQILRLTCKRFNALVDFHRLVLDSGFGPTRLWMDAVADCSGPAEFAWMVFWLDDRGAFPYLPLGRVKRPFRRWGVGLDPYMDELAKRLSQRMVAKDAFLYPFDLVKAMAAGGFSYERVTQLLSAMDIKQPGRKQLVRLFLNYANDANADDAIRTFEREKGKRFVRGELRSTCREGVYRRLVVERGYTLINTLYAMRWETDPARFSSLLQTYLDKMRTMASTLTRELGEEIYDTMQTVCAGVSEFYWVEQMDHLLIEQLVLHLVGQQNIACLEIIRLNAPRWFEITSGIVNTCLSANLPASLEYALRTPFVLYRVKPYHLLSWVADALLFGRYHLADLIMRERGDEVALLLPYEVVALCKEDEEYLRGRRDWFVCTEITSSTPTRERDEVMAKCANRIDCMEYGETKTSHAKICSDVNWFLEKNFEWMETEELRGALRVMFRHQDWRGDTRLLDRMLERIHSDGLDVGLSFTPSPLSLEWIRPRLNAESIATLAGRGGFDIHCVRWCLHNGYLAQLVEAMGTVSGPIATQDATNDEDKKNGKRAREYLFWYKWRDETDSMVMGSIYRAVKCWRTAYPTLFRHVDEAWDGVVVRFCYHNRNRKG